MSNLLSKLETWKRACCLVAVVLLVWGWGGVVEAQETGRQETSTQESSEYSAVLKAANAAYNAENYEEAEKGFIEAIQARPQAPVPYRNLARTYFWRSDYAAAVAYYDMYLRLADNAEDKEQVQSERRLASSRAGDALWTTPNTQKRALEALEQRLESGDAYTRGGGGAWGVYQGLLRSGYAQPDLSRLRRRLVSRLLDEFEGTFVPEASQPMPRLELADWQLQKERLAAARELVSDEALLSVIERRSSVVEVGLALLNNRYEEAARLAKTAIEQNPDMGFVRWLEVSALVDSGQNKAALETIDTLAKELARSRPDQLGYAKVLRAAVLQRVERGDDAADLYLGLVGK